jgi:putative nucleotidyltransferase with HDIG domain
MLTGTHSNIASPAPPRATAGRTRRVQAEGLPVGYGGGLAGALKQMGRLPALYESRRRFEDALHDDASGPRDIAETIVSDLGLATAILRAANHPRRGRGARVATLPEAIELLPRELLIAIGERVATYDIFDRDPVWDLSVEQHRIHAVATQIFAGRVATKVGYREGDALLVVALLHDIGKLVLGQAASAYVGSGDDETPDARLAAERRDLGIDHASIGALLLRRWRFPAALARTVARHHDPDASGPAALVRLADMLAHYHSGARVEPHAISRAAESVGLSPTDLRALLTGLPAGGGSVGSGSPCPLSSRELAVVRAIAAGGKYDEIAASMGLSASTVRSHLFNAAKRIGVRDRAQAVLVAAERGWL